MSANASPIATSRLPAVRRAPDGSRHVDLRAVLALALPLMLNSTVQLVLNLTDTWFIGRISTEAMAAMGAVHFLAIVFLLGVGGVGLAVQTFVAQAYGAGQSRKAAKSAWLGLWATLILAPAYGVLAFAGPALLGPFGLPPAIADLAVQWWYPRMLGGPLAVALWALSGFFNGIGRTMITLGIMAVVAACNAVLNDVLIFRFGWGVAGSGWATTISLAVGCVLAALVFLSAAMQRPYATRLTWRPRRRGLRSVFAMGVPTGLFPAVDVAAVSLFQIMQVRLGAVEGAATQIVMMLTSIAYLPAIGLAMAGTTLVGQSIGARDKAWAQKLGNTIVLLSVAYMGAIGVAIAVGGPWLVPLFTDMSRPGASEVVRLGVMLVWIAGAYQIFDALNLACAFCLRGAGDVKTPTRYLLVLAWLGFVPLAHMLSFARGEGWTDVLPQFGWGVTGGWIAALAYIVVLGTMLYLRWRSAAWQRLQLT